MAETGVKPYLFHLQPNCFLVVVVYVIQTGNKDDINGKGRKHRTKFFRGHFVLNI